MIRIFVNNDSTNVITDWAQTNNIGIGIENQSAASGKNLTKFPCIVELDNAGNVVKIFADSVKGFMDIQSPTMDEIRSKI